MMTPALILPALVREHRDYLEHNAELARVAQSARGANPTTWRQGRRPFGRVRHRTRLVLGM
jgi:hypothetical protein